MKVLFLDIDGVLNSVDWCMAGNRFGCPPREGTPPTKEGLRWCPDMVNRLRRVIEATDAKIVVSSSWRGYGDMASMMWRAMFSVYGWDDAPVIGETPDLNRRVNGIYVAKIRGDEVRAWLKDHDLVTGHAIVDDDADFHPEQPLVKTSMQIGLTDDDADELIALLHPKLGDEPHE